MKTLPKGNLQTDRLTDAGLTTVAQSLVNGLTAEAVTFPTPPITLIAFQTMIDDYKSASATAKKGTTNDTDNKKAKKTILVNNFRSMVQYVNQVINKTYQTTPSADYDKLRALVTSVGIKAKLPNTRPNPNGNSKTPVTIFSSKRSGRGRGKNIDNVLKINVVAKTKFDRAAVKQYWLQYRLVTTPESAFTNFISSTSRIQVPELTAGLYEYKVAALGGISRDNTQVIWSPIQQAVVTGITL